MIGIVLDHYSLTRNTIALFILPVSALLQVLSEVKQAASSSRVINIRLGLKDYIPIKELAFSCILAGK